MSVLLFPVVVMLLASPADRAAFQLAPDLARAEHVFFGTVADLKADGVKATVLTPLKGALKKGEALEGRLQGDQFTRPAAPKGTVLVVAGDGRLEAFAANSFEAHYAAPTLALLGGSADLAPFKLKTTSRELASQLLHHVFGHEVIALGVREAALRELLARATPEWETDLMALPPALRLPSLSTAFVEYFTRFPRAAFTSAARWAVFSELASRDAVPYLAKELDELRVTDDVNVARYAVEALSASDAAAARCVFEAVLAQGGLWLGREAANREAELDLRTRIARAASAEPCKAYGFRRDLPFPTDAQSLRRVALFSDDQALVPALVSWSVKQKDTALAESALWAAGRIAERAPQNESGEGVAALLAEQFKTRGAPVMHGASGALTRLITRKPALFDWLLAHPTPMSGAYGRPDDLLEAVCAQLDWSDAAFARVVLRKLLEQKKAPPGLRELHRAQPALLRDEVAARLARPDAASLVTALQLSARAGIDSMALSELNRLLPHVDAGVRRAAVDALFSHLVGSEQYARGVPFFPALLDRLGDDDAAVRKAAAALVNQLAVKSRYPQYERACPELATLTQAVLTRAAQAKGAERARLVEALEAFSPELFTGELAKQRAALGAMH